MTTYCQQVTVCQSADTLAEESMCRFMCLQYPQTSFFLLIEALSPYRIWQHSARQSLQELLILEQDFCLSIIFQSIEYSLPSSLSEWTYLLNLVLVRYFSQRNVETWLCTLDFRVGSQEPVYVSTVSTSSSPNSVLSVVSVDLTAAPYTTEDWRHCPDAGPLTMQFSRPARQLQLQGAGAGAAAGTGSSPAVAAAGTGLSSARATSGTGSSSAGGWTGN